MYVHLSVTRRDEHNKNGFGIALNLMREAFTDSGEFTRTVLRQELLPGVVSSSRLDKFSTSFGGVWVTADWLPIVFRISSNNVPKSLIFRAQGLQTRSE